MDIKKIIRLFLCSLLVIFFFSFWGCSVEEAGGSNEGPGENIPREPVVDPAWESWIKENADTIGSLTDNSSFEDLRFLSTYIGERKLVQLGESSHGVREFNQVKVRLIRYLHEQLGFNVIAFESGIFECYYSYLNAGSHTPDSLMKDSIFGVWSTDEVVELFGYILETRSTANPLILAGFDTQFSGRARDMRPGFLKEIIEKIDPGYADEVFSFDMDLISQLGSKDFETWAEENFETLSEFYSNLADYIESNFKSLVKQNGGDEIRIHIARQSALSTIEYMKQRISDAWEGSYIRDQGMAENLIFLKETIFPKEKIIVWAHNYHIRHNNSQVQQVQVSHRETMGYWVAEHCRSDMYTVGLYMGEGQAAMNDRTIYQILVPLDNSLEAVCGKTGDDQVFVDLLHRNESDGNSWMDTLIHAFSWGTNELKLVPRNQYDGILYIQTVHAPNYR